MKHFKVKVILLILFILLNFIFSYIYIVLPKQLNYISKNDINNTINLLNKNNININYNIIPKITPKMSIPIVKNNISSYNEFAQILLGQAQKNSNNIYTNNENTLKFDGNKFVLNISQTQGNIYKNTTFDNVGKISKKIAENYNFELAGTIIRTYQQNDNTFSSHIIRTCNGIPIFNDYINLKFSQNGLTSIDGVWFYDICKSSKNYIPRSAIDALTEFALNDSHSGVTITELELGYLCRYPDSYTKEVTLSPVWRIFTSDKTEHFIDA